MNKNLFPFFMTSFRVRNDSVSDYVIQLRNSLKGFRFEFILEYPLHPSQDYEIHHFNPLEGVREGWRGCWVENMKKEDGSNASFSVINNRMFRFETGLNQYSITITDWS